MIEFESIFIMIDYCRRFYWIKKRNLQSLCRILLI